MKVRFLNALGFWLSIVFFNFIAFGSFAQQTAFNFRSYGLTDGLSNTHVSCIIQDSKGFLWIGTKNGLNRFDGYRFINYFHDPDDKLGLPDNAIFDLFLDKENQLWVGTFKGLCRYEPSSDSFTHFPIAEGDVSLKYSPVKAIDQAENGDLWLGTSNAGLVRFSPKANRWKIYRHEPGNLQSIASNFLLDVLIDKNGNIWAGNQYDGVSVLNTQSEVFSHFNKNNYKLLDNNILSLYETHNGSIWIGTSAGGASVWNPETGTITHHVNKPGNANSLSNNMVYDILTDKNQQLWLATEGGGLNKYISETNSFEAFTTNSDNVSGLINDKIRCLYEDNSGNLWLGIHQGGVNFKSNRKAVFEHLSHQSNANAALSNNSVLVVCAIDTNTVWIGTDGGGLNIWDIKQNKIKQVAVTDTKSGLPDKVIRSIYKDHKNQIWVGTYLNGLSKYDAKTGLFKIYRHSPTDVQTISNNDVTSITEDRMGNLWVGTNGGGINLFDREKETFRRFYSIKNNEKSLANNWVLSLYADKKGFVWVGTYWGLSRLDPLTFEFNNLKTADSVPDTNTYYCLLEDAKGRMWAGTSNWLKLLQPDSKTQPIITIKNGFSNNTINGILEDKAGNLWISTDNGLACFNYDKNTLKNYFSGDGLQSNEFIQGSFAKGPDGMLYFGGINGLNRFSPENMQVNMQAPVVFITDFMIFNQSVSVGIQPDGRTILKHSILETQLIELDYNDNSFSFEFTALDFNLPDKITYACRMLGLNNDWSYYDHTRRIVTFTNLDFGTYYFEVKAANNDGVWGKPTRLTLVIHPPVWLTWWAISLYVIAVLVVLFLLLRAYRLRLIEKNRLKVERLTRLKDQEISEAKLLFFTNISHEFRTPLTLILGPLEAMLESKQFNEETRKQFRLMHRNANRLLRLINQLMDLRKIDAGKVVVSAEEQDLVAFIREIYDSFVLLAQKRNIEFVFETNFEKKTLWFDSEKMDKVMFNLLSNAFKFTPENGKITISLAQHSLKEYIALKISDNGKGIAKHKLARIYERFYQADSDPQLQRGTGIGLWLTKNYVELHKGIIHVESAEGQGTSFLILLREGKKHFEPAQIVTQKQAHIHLQPSVLDETTEFFTAEEQIDPNTEKQCILIVEDNDDIRNYIKSGLEKKYLIIEAKNGKEGLETALEELPDLVITDIMMPEMDGISLCKKLKTDIQTCHIPVIMLTAKTSIEHRIEGLETGADSYIPKPFNPMHLAVRIKKLLELRQTLKQKFSNEISFDPEDIAIASHDQKLLQKVVTLIKANIAEPELSIDMISTEVGMSKRHLQRKLKSLTGQSPNEFIRILRLKQAAEILSKNDISISEVAYMVGFSSASYFSTCFTKQYNISPLQYKEGKN